MAVLDDFSPAAKVEADEERKARDLAYAERQRERDQRTGLAIRIVRSIRDRRLAGLQPPPKPLDRQLVERSAWWGALREADEEITRTLAAAGLSWDDVDFRSV
jgi:hypothetical protein